MKLVVPLTMPITGGDLVADQGLPQRPDDRDGPGDGRLEVEVDPGLLGRGEQGGAVLGEQRLVGRDHRRAVVQRGQDQRPGGFDATDDLDHQVDVGPADQSLGVGGEQVGVDARRAGGSTDGPLSRPAPAVDRSGRAGRRLSR